MALDEQPWYLHATTRHTCANGPGVRFAVWVQGCTLACAGCFNPETHAAGGVAATTASVFTDLIEALPVDGITITGGEPLQQPVALAHFLALFRSDLRTADKSVVVLTGYSLAEILSDPRKVLAIKEVDTVVSGRYNQRKRIASGLRGSSNKQYWHRTGRHDDRDFANTPESEILVLPDGSVTITGMRGVSEVLNP